MAIDQHRDPIPVAMEMDVVPIRGKTITAQVGSRRIEDPGSVKRTGDCHGYSGNADLREARRVASDIEPDHTATTARIGKLLTPAPPGFHLLTDSGASSARAVAQLAPSRVE